MDTMTTKQVAALMDLSPAQVTRRVDGWPGFPAPVACAGTNHGKTFNAQEIRTWHKRYMAAKALIEELTSGKKESPVAVNNQA